MKLMIFYAIGYVIAAVWTAVWVLREEVEESKAFRIGFAAVMGALSWVLVIIYLMAWCDGRREHGKH
jgi:hypothetical protein